MVRSSGLVALLATTDLARFALSSESIIFSDVLDAAAVDTAYAETLDGYQFGEASSLSCLASPGPSDPATVVESDPDYLKVLTTPWHSGGLYFDCLEKINWQCTKSCYGPYPNFSAYDFLVFKAKYSADSSCPPTLGLSKRWPGYGSKVLELAGDYVAGGKLVSDEYRQVVIPTADLVSDEECCDDPNDPTTCVLCWPSLTDVKGMWFRTCGAVAEYHIADVKLTDIPPIIPPSKNVIFDVASDAHAHDTAYAETLAEYTMGEVSEMSCLLNYYPNVTTVVESTSDVHLFIKTTPWHSGGMSFDCLEKIYWQCTKSCNGPNPSFTEFPYLVFKAKYHETSGCAPRVSLGKRWPMYSSKVLDITGPYVDGGKLLPNDYRQVVIPTVDLIDWDDICCTDPADNSTCSVCWPDLDGVKTLVFQTCGTVAEYTIKDLRLVENPPAIQEAPPTPDPSSSPSTQPSTTSPTRFPTVADTATPTRQPTFSPTTSTPTNSPVDDHFGDFTTLTAGPTILPISEPDQLLTLTQGNVDNSTGMVSHIVPLARSYDGYEWETAAGDLATRLFRGNSWICNSEGCEVSLPELRMDEAYLLSTYSHTLTKHERIARFMEMTTFGVTTATLHSWDSSYDDVDMGDDVASWLKEQMDEKLVGMTSHREYFRLRVGDRLSHPRRAVRPDHPCSKKSRWRKFTFSSRDTMYYLSLTLRISGSGPYILRLDGHPRTVVQNITFYDDAYADHVFDENFEYRLCWGPEEKVGGDVGILLEDDSCQKFPNPLVSFVGYEYLPTYTLELPGDNDLFHGDEFILASALNSTVCDKIPEVVEEGDAPIFGILPDGTWLQHDPHAILEKNTVDDPIPDGGGATELATGGETRCSNVPRTFLNEDKCFLSTALSSCGSVATPETLITLDEGNIRTMQTLTGRYVYSVLNLTLAVEHGHPCTPGLRSRWELIETSSCVPSTLGPKTSSALMDLLQNSGGSNVLIRDIFFPHQGMDCDISDTDVEIDVLVVDSCWRRVHPEHKSVFDMTFWTREDAHPGNMYATSNGRPNPIKKWADIHKSAFLPFPSTHPSLPGFDHPISRWDDNTHKFRYVGRFGDFIRFRDLPNELRLDQVAEHYGAIGSIGGEGVLVCGSPSEVANDDPNAGSYFGWASQKDPSYYLGRNKQHVWTMIALDASDQLRQRVAWALGQIFVLAKPSVEAWEYHSEMFLDYYDIFVKGAFGSYRDILKRVSYNSLMAENLSYLQSRSAAYMWEQYQQISFADENFAREIMQLFSTGVVQLNMDGTPKLDEQGRKILVYTNDDVMSYARAWTGFDRHPQRGNIEDAAWTGNRLDPMRIDAMWRDRFPKTDLDGGYIGDKYPLCTDFPTKMFLKKGARYRLLGSSSRPELMEDPSTFVEYESSIVKFMLDENSSLRGKLCSQNASGSCDFPTMVLIDSNLDCFGQECEVDTVRVVQIQTNVFYEYVSPPCVQMAYYKEAKKVQGRFKHSSDASCANPLLPVASEACCETGSEWRAVRNSVFDGERMTYMTAENRCFSLSRESCNYEELQGDWYKAGTHWTTSPCSLHVKVKGDGYTAIVYEPTDHVSKVKHIDSETRNFFKVYWNDDYPNENNECASGACEALSEGGCLCGSDVVESPVFVEMPESIDLALASLYIGAVDPSSYDAGIYSSTFDVTTGITAYTIGGSIDKNTVFGFTDGLGRNHWLKNSRQTVIVPGTSMSFRNPPHFMSLLHSESNVRDAQYETEATLDSYFYHDNTAPFVAVRLIQRLVTSNPSLRYVEAVSSAFQTGSYHFGDHTFGSSKYGDLAATVAAILLDREARSVVLDADPAHGSLREPILKVIHLMRSMEFRPLPQEPVVRLLHMDEHIGQMAHASPTVFSFFLPEYAPHGRVGEANLVGPEALILDMPKTVGLLNGLLSLVKTGLSPCYNGFTDGDGGGCGEGTYERATGILEFSGESNDTIDELATLLTAGRLNLENRRIIKEAYDAAADSAAGLRIAQQLIATTAEFHSTNPIRKSGQKRNPFVPPQSSGNPYKAVVFLNFAGGCDSYNMLVPHTCTGPKDLHAEYVTVRQQLALAKGDLLPINATSQICDTFGIHPDLKTVQELYKDGDLLFFANTGILTKPVNKENYYQETVTQLFAHNHMSRETKRIDPFEEVVGTGVIGRMGDILSRNGNSIGSFSIDMSSIALVGKPQVSPTTNIIGRNGVDAFNEAPSAPNMMETIAKLNEATTADSGFFAETWSSSMLHSLAQNDLLHSTMAESTSSHEFPQTDLGKRLEVITKIIKTREQRGVDADMFYVDLGGFDTHSDSNDRLAALFSEVDGAIAAFVTELKSMDLWDSVTTIQASEFARTLAPNTGDGTDHAWGGNNFLFGGNVKGGQIVGEYPSDFTDDGLLGIGRGRFIPTTSFDACFGAVAEWLGIPAEDLDEVCPNRHQSMGSQLLSGHDVFDSIDSRRNSRYYLRK